jgi:hypothetical protein
VTKAINAFNIKASRSKLACTRRSTVLSFPPRRGLPGEVACSPLSPSFVLHKERCMDMRVAASEAEQSVDAQQKKKKKLLAKPDLIFFVLNVKRSVKGRKIVCQ